MINRYHPDIILLDLDMPKTNGMEVVRYTNKHFPDTIAILLSALIDTVTYQEAIAIGTRGFLSKTAAALEIETCLDTVTAGNHYIDEHLAQRLGSEMLRENLCVNEYDLLLKNLTERELEVLSLIMEGCTSVQIADTLHNSIKTIETHRSNIADKLDIKGRSRLSSFVTKNKVSLEKAFSRVSVNSR